MQKFVDNLGRVWPMEITTATIKRVQTLTGVNLFAVVDGELIERLQGDIILFCDVLYAICKPQADKEHVTDEQFGEGLAGSAIDEATAAFVEAMIAYLPERHRHRTQAAVAKIQRTEKQLNEMISRKLEDTTIEQSVIAKAEQEMDRRLARLQSSDWSTSSPESSVSILDL